MILLKPIGKFLLLFISIPCFAQWNLNSPDKELIDSLDNLNYLKPFKIIQNPNYKTWCDKNFPYYYPQIEAAYSAKIHNFDYVNLFERNKIKVNHVSYKKANSYIVQKAKNHTFLMFNEEHHNPFHRLYVETLLLHLKKEGYTQLSLEGLSHKDKDINKRGYPLSFSGYYIVEPYFANMIRTALELGFTIQSHERTDSSDHFEREKQQAQNLYKLVKNHPNQKIIVYAGYAHIAEKPPKQHNQYKRMAQLFTELSGINPFTIDQTELSKNSSIHTISIPFKNNNPYAPQEIKGMYDIVLSYPSEVSYLHKKLGKKAYNISFQSLKNKKLIQFYIKDEYEKHQEQSIPYEQFLITQKEQIAYLDPKKDYIVIIRNDQYNITDTLHLKKKHIIIK